MLGRKTVEKDIRGAMKVIARINTQNFPYDTYDQIQYKGTENLIETFNADKTQDFSSCLIVAGSGDQAMEAINHGAKVIDTFDINRLDYYGTALNYAARKALPYDEYMQFYTRGFPVHLFLKLQKFLAPDVLMFWQTLFATFNGEIIHCNLFDTNRHGQSIYEESLISAYQPAVYEKIRSRLHEVEPTFKEVNILGNKPLPFPKDAYKYIYLSNIFRYGKLSLEEYQQLVEERLVPLLQVGGRVVLNYEYKQFPEIQPSNILELLMMQSDLEYNRNFRSAFENTNGCQYETFSVFTSGYGRGINNQDMVYTLKRIK